MVNTVYTIHSARDNRIVAVYEFEGNKGIDHARQAMQVAMDHENGTHRFYIHNGLGIIAAFLTRGGSAHEVRRDDYMRLRDAASNARAVAGHHN